MSAVTLPVCFASASATQAGEQGRRKTCNGCFLCLWVKRCIRLAGATSRSPHWKATMRATQGFGRYARGNFGRHKY